MKPVFQCEYCNYMGNAENVESHERQCVKNPAVIEKNRILEGIAKECPYKKVCHTSISHHYRCGRRPIKSPQSGYAYCAPIESCAKYSEKDSKISWKAW